MQMTPYAMALRSSSAVCETSLVRLADEQTLLRRSSPQSLDEFGNGEPNSILWNAPREEGVYELRFKLEPRRTLPGLIHRQPNVERAVQFVVYNNSPWTTVASRTNYAKPTGTAQPFSFTARSARYIRITGSSLRANPNDSNSYRMQIAEIQVISVP